MSNPIGVNYNNLKDKLESFVIKIDNVMLDKKYHRPKSQREHHKFKMLEIFKNHQIILDFNGIFHIERLSFSNSKLRIDIRMQSLSFCYDLHELSLFVDNVNVTWEDGPWYDYAFNTILPIIDESLKEVIDFVDKEVSTERETYRKDIELARQKF